jgi:hypothetical protein
MAQAGRLLPQSHIDGVGVPAEDYFNSCSVNIYDFPGELDNASANRLHVDQGIVCMHGERESERVRAREREREREERERERARERERERTRGRVRERERERVRESARARDRDKAGAWR